MTSSTTNDLLSVWGSSASDVWAVGQNGVALHYDGSVWTVESPAGAGYLPTVTGSGPNDVWTTDSGSNIYHFDGTGWHSVPALVPGGTIFLGLAAPAPGVLWVAGFQPPSAGAIDTVVLYPSNGVTLGTPQHGTAIFLSNNWANTTAVLAASATDVWVGSGPNSHSDGVTLASVTGRFGRSYWRAPTGEIFAGTLGPSVDVLSGGTWTPSNTGTAGLTAGVWGTSATRVFAAAYLSGTNAGEVRVYNGLGWANEPIPAGTVSLYGVYAAPTGEVFAVGRAGTILKGP